MSRILIFPTMSTYSDKKFQEIEYDTLKRCHPTSNGICVNGSGQSLYIVARNDPGYTDRFEQNGNIIEYERSRKKTDNAKLDRLTGDVPIRIFLNARRQGRGYYFCGIYNILRKSPNGWVLNRITSPAT